MSIVDSTGKINDAVHECLNRCYASPTPVLCLTEYLKRLMDTRVWTVDELAAVRSAAVRILRNIAAPQEDDGLPIGFDLEFRG
jgi:hypothetical protein